MQSYGLWGYGYTTSYCYAMLWPPTIVVLGLATMTSKKLCLLSLPAHQLVSPDSFTSMLMFMFLSLGDPILMTTSTAASRPVRGADESAVEPAGQGSSWTRVSRCQVGPGMLAVDCL